jgi:hypothetical protein
LPCGVWSIIDVYALNKPLKINNLWEMVKLKIFKNCIWVLCDDLNMVEKAANKSSCCGRLISKKEIYCGRFLKLSLDVEKPLRFEGSVMYSWDNQHIGGH